MNELLVHLRAMQLFTHNAHNMCARLAFFQDHEFFGETYKSIENSYDDVIERIIGLTSEDSVLSLQDIISRVDIKLKNAPSKSVKENLTFYTFLLEMETQLYVIIEKIITSKPTCGTEQLVGEIANQCEMRQYKIKQRIKR